MTRFPDIKTATLVGNFSNTDPEWHELRKGKIGGSQVGTIAGLNKWESAVTFFYKFTGKISDTIEQSPAMEWGHRLEAVVIDKFEDEHPALTVHRDVGTWVNNERPYQLANPDALLERDGELGVLEIKTARYQDDWIDSNGEWRVPDYYLTQVNWYLSCLGLKWAWVAVLFSGSDYHEFYIEHKPFQEQVDIQLVEAFLDSVRNDSPPAWDGAANTYETARKLHPEIDGSEVELGQLGADYLQAFIEAQEATERLLKLKSEVIAEMRFAKVGNVGGVARFWRRSRSGGTPFLVVK
jgi:putative phage-type endonuclease